MYCLSKVLDSSHFSLKGDGAHTDIRLIFHFGCKLYDLSPVLAQLLQ